MNVHSTTFSSQAITRISIRPLGDGVHTQKAYEALIEACRRCYSPSFPLILCPAHQLTRPGDWRYDATPLSDFDWQEGCIRIEFVLGGAFEGTENASAMRETYMFIGVLSTLDCKSSQDFCDFQHSLDHVSNKRLFVFDSFMESSENIDINASRVVNPNELVAFPPVTQDTVMDMHLNVVVNDLAVAIFLDLEARIKHNDSLVNNPLLIKVDDSAKLLMTALDNVRPDQKLSAKERIEVVRKREVARREKQSADLCLRLGSPADAYKRYNRASELTMAFSPDPLWYALSLEGCAASLVAMADAGGHGADDFLETSFQCPGEIINAANGLASNPEMKAVFAVDKTKTTLPAAVYSLAEEALEVLVKYSSMDVLYTRLLIKLARYAAESEDTHMRCRWGEGQDCYQPHITSGNMRWDNSSMALVHALVGSLDDLPALKFVYHQYSIKRCQNCAAFLHRAVSAGGLDLNSRAEAAMIGARVCLAGVKGTPFGKDRTSTFSPMPRKAGFFTLIAAEAFCSDPKASSEVATRLWLATAKIYTGKGNSPDENGHYAWATLRSSVLQSLSQQSNPGISEKAMELLIMLLSELSPDPGVKRSYSRSVTSFDNVSVPTMNQKPDVRVIAETKKEASEDDMQLDSSTTPGPTSELAYGESSRKHSTVLKEIHARKSIPPVDLPQFEFFSSGGEKNQLQHHQIMSLRCSRAYLRFETCSTAQRRFLQDLVTLRESRPTVTFLENCHEGSSYNTGDPSSMNPVPYPLALVNASIVPLEAHLLLERTKAHGVTPKKTGSMATFFNPFAKKSDALDGQPTLVAEGEERTIFIQFNNHLAVNLDVPCCELEFSANVNDSIEAPPLSFTIPAKSEGFTVRFPFTLVQVRDGTVDKSADDESNSSMKAFELLGLRVTTFDRCFFLALSENGKENQQIPTLIPPSKSIYQRSSHDKTTKTKQSALKIESVPPQPKLLVSFKNSHTPLEDSAIVPVHISDGEIFSIPSFRLENDHGSSGEGKLVQLQIISVGLPGIPDEVIFDTHGFQVEDENSDASSDDFEELMDEDGLPPLRMKANCDDVSLEGINDKSKSGCIATFQMAAAHDLGKQLESKKSNIRLRFRYRGVSNDEVTLIWRRREVKLHVVRVKGPRISSMTFRPDLSWGSAVYELSKSLAQQVEKSDGTRKSDGTQFSTNFSGDEIVVLVAVANECKSTIILSNKVGRVGGFEGSPMPTVRVTSGVSVKIPVVIQRIPLTDEAGEEVDVAQELITRTALQWVSEKGEGIDAGVRTGRVRIPQRCLKRLIDDHTSFISKVCQVPVSVTVEIMDRDVNETIATRPGNFFDVHLSFRFQEWVPAEVISKCSLIVEFCCARKEVGGSVIRQVEAKDDAYFWCGQIRQVIKADELKEKGKTGIVHRAKLTFIQRETFVVSACARLVGREGLNREEIWWAPRAYQVRVMGKE